MVKRRLNFRLKKHEMSIARTSSADALQEFARAVIAREEEWKEKVKNGALIAPVANQRYFRLLKAYQLLDKLVTNPQLLEELTGKSGEEEQQLNLDL